MSIHNAIPHLFDFGALDQDPAGGTKERELSAETREERASRGASVHADKSAPASIRAMFQLWTTTGYARG
jgi:hypothetical protein